MKITKIGVKTGAIFCKKCGEILQIEMDMKKVECPSCGASSPRSKLIGDGGDFGHFVEEPVPGHSSTRVQRKIFAQMAGGRQWRIHFFVRGPGVDLPLTLKNANPDGEGWIVDYNSGCHGYFVSRLFEGGQDGLKAILRAIPSFVQEGKDRARDALLRKIDGAGAIDIGSSSFAQHEDECAKAQILKDLGLCAFVLVLGERRRADVYSTCSVYLSEQGISCPVLTFLDKGRNCAQNGFEAILPSLKQSADKIAMAAAVIVDYPTLSIRVGIFKCEGQIYPWAPHKKMNPPLAAPRHLCKDFSLHSRGGVPRDWLFHEVSKIASIPDQFRTGTGSATGWTFNFFHVHLYLQNFATFFTKYGTSFHSDFSNFHFFPPLIRVVRLISDKTSPPNESY